MEDWICNSVVTCYFIYPSPCQFIRYRDDSFYNRCNGNRSSSLLPASTLPGSGLSPGGNYGPLPGSRSYTQGVSEITFSNPYPSTTTATTNTLANTNTARATIKRKAATSQPPSPKKSKAVPHSTAAKDKGPAHKFTVEQETFLAVIYGETETFDVLYGPSASNRQGVTRESVHKEVVILFNNHPFQQPPFPSCPLNLTQIKNKYFDMRSFYKAAQGIKNQTRAGDLPGKSLQQ